MRLPGPRLARVAACVVLAAGGFSACSSGKAAPSDFCKSVDGVDAMLTQITSTPITKSGLDTLKTQLGQLSTAVVNLKDNTVEEFSTEVDAVTAAAVPLGRDIRAGLANPSDSAYRAIQGSLSTFKAAVNDLATSSSTSC